MGSNFKSSLSSALAPAKLIPVHFPRGDHSSFLRGDSSEEVPFLDFGHCCAHAHPVGREKSRSRLGDRHSHLRSDGAAHSRRSPPPPAAGPQARNGKNVARSPNIFFCHIWQIVTRPLGLRKWTRVIFVVIIFPSKLMLAVPG